MGETKRMGGVGVPGQASPAPADTIVDPSRTFEQTSQELRTVRRSLLARATMEPYSREAPARYGIARVLGRGGMGEVLLAEDRDVGRRIAIKHALGEGPEAHALVADEVRMMGRLEHPNIASIYDVDVDQDGRLFFTMQYVDGETLGAVIERLRAGDPATHRTYSLGRRLDVFEGILNALSHAHAVGVIHRDVKPANVLLGPSGEVFLSDWGIAVAAGASGDLRVPRARPGEIIGTPWYMAPEQARGELVDGRADVYSAFVLLFELLTLQRYFPTARTADEALEHARRPRPPWVFGPLYGSTVGGQQPVPLEYRHYLVHGLAPQREQRFATARDALVALERIRSGDIAVQCPVTLMKAIEGAMHRWMARRPALMMAMMMIMVTLTIAALVVARFRVMAR